MNKKRKFLGSLLAGTMLISSLAGCASTSEPEETTGQSTNTNTSTNTSITKKDPVTLQVFLFGDENNHYRNVEPVIEEFEKRTKDTLNTKLNVTFTPPGEWGQKLQLFFASGEKMDLIFPFDGPKYAKDGALADLGEYFNNPEYPGLMKAFSEEYINNNKFYDKTYLIPITNTFMDMEGVWYRKDLLTKYGLKDITSYDDLYNYLEQISENEKDYNPFGNYGTYAFFKLFAEPSERKLDGKVFSFIGDENPKVNYIDVQIADDGKSVEAIAAYGDPDSEWAGFKSGYGKEYLLNMFHQCTRFNKFIPADTLTATAATGKDSTAGYITLSNFQSFTVREKAKYPEAEFGFWPLYKNSQNMTPGGQATEGKAWNFLAVPVTSTKIDRTMEFLDWVFASQENNDLFTYGIEGEHWEAVGENEWKIQDDIDPATNYMWPGYQLTWNPTLVRIPAGLSNQTKKYYEYQYNPDTFKKHALAGFTFDQEPVKTEIAKCSTVIQTYLPFLLSGFGEVDEHLTRMNQELRASGVDKIKEELKNQINDFLAQK